MMDHQFNEDANNNPNGGSTHGIGLTINWQRGVMSPDCLQSGCFVKDAISAAVARLQYYQDVADGRFRCRQNAIAITKLEEALLWLHHRSSDRLARGVEGTHKP